MSSESAGWRLSAAVRWRNLDDGVVVYVPETCETHLLPRAFGELLCDQKRLQVFLLLGDGAFDAAGFDDETRAAIAELVDLKILEDCA